MKFTPIALALLAGLSLSGAAQAALVDRGGGLIYDTDLNVTWLQDANYAQTSGYDPDGRMTWENAVNWAANLSYYDSVRNVTYTDWRLPSVEPINGSTFNYNFSTDGTTDNSYHITSTQSEMSHLHYVTLGNPGYYTTTGDVSGCYPVGTCLDNVGPFRNLQAAGYWSAREDASNTDRAWVFFFMIGGQTQPTKDNSYYALAVRPGDVAAVPEASTYGMMLAGLGLVGFMARRRKQAGVWSSS